MSELNEAEFERIADEELHALVEALIACSDEIDPDLQSGVLSIAFEDGTKYVVNSHRAARQIWMAADRSAWHFDHQPDGRWIATQSGDELWSAVRRVVAAKLGADIQLQR